KPSGCTSHDVVARIRRVVAEKRVGHAGTLDPSATGVLIIGVGRATRLLQFIQHLPKTYIATARFGVTTTTQDADGEVIAQRPFEDSLGGLTAVLDDYRGEIKQIPPMVSAVKVGGEPLYRAARRGEEVPRPPRAVHVYDLIIDDLDAAAGTATFTVTCSSGTYVRTLVADIGEAIGCGAHLIELRRTSIGSFTVSECTPLAVIEQAPQEHPLLSMAEAMRDFPNLTVSGAELDDAIHGRPITADLQPSRAGEIHVISAPRAGQRPAHEVGMSAGIPVAILDTQGTLRAVYRKNVKGFVAAAVFE
ncbi:MAG TPA: tRNA pseudouridine(55) synthase TruB, partial [Actinomycetota bacterium]|nr:tRNA pseudouridine(55) synthase TruB [Actinomycetota bacterium]